MIDAIGAVLMLMLAWQLHGLARELRERADALDKDRWRRE